MRECCAALDAALDARLFRALGDPTRIRILVLLAGCAGPQTVTGVARHCDVDLSVVSRHLAALREAGVLTARKEGREVRYELCYDRVARALRTLADALQACCTPAPARRD